VNRPIDLTPMQCRETLGRRARIRRWAIAYAATMVAVAGSVVASSAGISERSMQRAKLAEEAKRRWERDEEVQRLLGEIRVVEENITRYNRLAWPLRVTEALDALGESVPGPIALTGLLVTPREEQVRGAKAGQTLPARSLLVVEIEGLSPSDSEVAAFVSRLEGNALFSQVRLEYTRSTTVDAVEAREFRVACEIDLLAKYRFVDGAALGSADGEGVAP